MNTLYLHGLLLCGLKNRPNDEPNYTLALLDAWKDLVNSVVDIDSIKDIIEHVVEESPTNITFRMGGNLQIIPISI